MAFSARIHQPNTSILGAQAGRTAAIARKDRRSPLRPQFRQGWRKHIPAGGHGATPAPDARFASPIYVWTAKVETLLACASNVGLLNADDRAALQMLRSRPIRESATAARILLRLALSVTTGRRLAPQDWLFGRNEFGKPFITDNIDGIEFSISHLDTVVVVAIGHGVSLGVDVESLDQQLENEVIDDFCHESERQVLNGLSAARRRRVFLEFWTEKEAYTKMLGVGHSLEFRSFSRVRPHNAAGDSAHLHAEKFYFSIDHALYHAALVVDRKDLLRPLDVQLMSAELPNSAGSASAPACCQHKWENNA